MILLVIIGLLFSFGYLVYIFAFTLYQSDSLITLESIKYEKKINISDIPSESLEHLIDLIGVNPLTDLEKDIILKYQNRNS